MMEPPYAGRHVRWCERSHGELIPMLLLDCPNLIKSLRSVKIEEKNEDFWKVVKE